MCIVNFNKLNTSEIRTKFIYFPKINKKIFNQQIFPAAQSFKTLNASGFYVFSTKTVDFQKGGGSDRLCEVYFDALQTDVYKRSIRHFTLQIEGIKVGSIRFRYPLITNLLTKCLLRSNILKTVTLFL